MKFQKLQNEKDYTNILDIVSTDRKYRSDYNYFYTTFTNFSMKYLVMCKVYTDVSGIE